jgi:F-type H+-transporting ATPase subunit a
VSSDIPVNEVQAAQRPADSDMASDTPETPKRRLSPKGLAVALIAIMLIIDVVAFIFVPPFPAEGKPGDACAFPVCYIEGTLEFPTPHIVWPPQPAGTVAAASGLVISTEPSIPSTIFTMWIVGGLLLIGILVMTRGGSGVPGRLQNVAEWAYESLEGFGVSLGGPPAKRYIPIFVSFFLLILFCNWAGLIPPIGKVEFLRAPTSDVNVTIGLALVAFAIIEVEGFRRLGVGYLGKFFPFYEFKNGVSAGIIALFVGLIELMLEFVKPLTLSMRLFGNIYGGEVALGVMTSLTIALVPVALLGLEFMLNFIQALIFSVLTLMFIVLAIESHHEEEGHMAEEAVASLEGHAIPAGAH